VVSDVIIEESTIGPVVRPRQETETVVLYLHGEPDGPESVLDSAARLALLAGATVVCPRYRPAFPAALIDAHSGYSYCQAIGPVVVVGDGLGAALATAMLAQLRDSEATSPRCAVLVSALLDLTLESRSLQFATTDDPAFDLTRLRARITSYARATPRTDSRLSPLYANLHGLPPTQLLVSGTDPLLDDSLAFATRAARSHVPLSLRVWPDSSSFRAEAPAAMAAFITAGALTAHTTS
jgi:monoterpene epsilon-lactone hydrolase